MRMRKIIYNIGIMAITLVLIGAVFYKSYKLEKPPLPQISVGNELLEPYLGLYEWNDGPKNDIDPKTFLRDKEYYPINPIEDLFLFFPGEKPINIEVNYIFEHPDANVPVYSGPVPDDELQLQIKNEPGIKIVAIKTEWDDDKRADYFVPIRKKRVNHYQHLFPEDENTYRLLYFYDEEVINVDPIYKTPLDGHFLPILYTYRYENKQQFQRSFPDLDVSGDQGFWLFDKKGIIFESHSVQDVINYFADLFQPTRFITGGIITEIDMDEKVIFAGNKKLYVEDIERYKLGQRLRVDVTFHDLIDEKKQTIHEIEIIEEQPEKMFDPKWFASKPGAYTILGLDVMLNLYADENDVEQLVETIHREDYPDNREFDLLFDHFIIYDEQGPVFISDRWFAIVKYLTEAVQ